MPQVKNDEQIRVGETLGLVSGSSSFTFDGTLGKKDYRGYEIVISELNGRGILVKGTDYTWNYQTGQFNLIEEGDQLQENQYYNIHFQPAVVTGTITPSSIIDASFFIRDINIPNTTNPAVLERLNEFISKYEKECLTKILGYSLYKAFLSESSTRMTELLVGAEYEDTGGDTRKWKGLVYDINYSLIANYIYYYWQYSNASQTTGNATAIPKAENSYNVSPADKMVNAWNGFSYETNDLISFLWMKNHSQYIEEKVYPEFTDRHICEVARFSRRINLLGI